MSGAIPPLPQYAFMAWYLVKHRDKFTFTLLLVVVVVVVVVVMVEVEE
jgi:hypothetical protein